jgi:hypothetical protein
MGVGAEIDEPRLGVDMVGFGAGEFAYLLNVLHGPASDKSVEVFRAADAVSDPVLLSAGASSLLARGYAEVEDEELGVSGVAAAVASCLGEATQWTEITLMTPESMDSVIQVESPTARLMFQPRLLATWFVFAQDPAKSPGRVTAEIVRQHALETQGGSASLTVRTLDDERRLLVRPDGGSWTVGVPDLENDRVAQSEGLGFEELVAWIERMHA